jgi:hypothetical protein
MVAMAGVALLFLVKENFVPIAGGPTTARCAS